MIFEFLGGLGVFLFGIKFMGEGLQKYAGERLKYILDRYTSNPVKGVLAGMFVTILIQSSSATTVITVGLVSAGFMKLRQSIGVVMGANIGTTITAFIIGIDMGKYSLLILAAGSLLLFFFKSQKLQHAGQVLFGFGGIFLGLDLMSSGMGPLKNLEVFHDLTLNMSTNPILGVVIGTFITIIIQSSSVTIGILQELYSQHLVELNAALPVLFGDNIGTTITAVLASIGASISAKRTALVHVIFNLIGTIIFLIILPFFTSSIYYLQGAFNLHPQMTVAVAHGAFNVANTLIQLPFVGLLAFIVMKLIPGDDSLVNYHTKYLDPVFIEQSPSIALGQGKEELLRMGHFAIRGLEETKLFFQTNLQPHAEAVAKMEESINYLDGRITDYLIHLSESPLTAAESEQHSMLVNTIRDIERIGDHFENIAELIDYQQQNKVQMSNEAKQQLNDMFQLTIEAVKFSIQSLDHSDKELAKDVVMKEEQIDKMERKLRKMHLLRLNSGDCTGQAGIVFVDIVSNLERIGDHAVNIADAVLELKQY
ncbi:Na/Pi cotransporter family protein [Falsibacillus albus]|uniref:Na/Pi cotransporter family protein n=2 Tax=Falsibacillus albus TaxID=2478915 RepID=A0A3L7K667_9BACI|nr:Na/Pi cotransporter family protein [Falsibacillus albus]